MPPLNATLLACCVAALVTGCTNYAPAPISPVDNARALDNRTLDDPRLRKFIVASLDSDGNTDPGPTWDLPRLTLAAIYYHPDLDIAHAKLVGAQAAVITARQRPNPTLSFANVFGQAAVATAAFPIGVAPVTIGPVINFLVETFGKREDRAMQAKYLAEAARLDLATAGWQVRGRVRTAMLNLWAAQQKLTLSRRRLGLQEQLVGLLERRFAVGEASSLDVSRERISRTQIILVIRDLDRLAAEARVQLSTSIGIQVQALDRVSVSLGAFDAQPLSATDLAIGELRREALTKRTDVQGSLQEYEAAQAALKLQVANQYPNVTLSPGYNYDFGVNKYLLGFGADLPIFNQNQGPILQALANRQQAAANFTALQAQIIGAIDQATATYRAATRSVATGDALLADVERRARQVADSFREGQVDRPTLITSDLEVAVTALSRFDAIVQQRQALGALEDALQQPLLDPGHAPTVPEQNPRLSHSEPAL